MKIKYAMLFFLAMLINFGCKKKEYEYEPLEGNVLLTITGNLIAADFPHYVFLSDKNGKVLTCEEHLGSEPNVLSIKNDLADDYFDFSLVRNFNPVRNTISIETYPNVQRTEWQFKSQYNNTVTGQTGHIILLKDSLVADAEYGIINGLNWILTSLAELQTTGAYRVQYDLDKNYIFLRIKLEGEDQHRYVEFNNLTNGDTITLDVANYPLGELEIIQSSGAEPVVIKKLTGLRVANSFEKSTNIYTHNFGVQDYTLPNGKVWYPSGIFDSFFVHLELKQDSVEYLLESMGPPIYDYTPTAPDLTFEGDKSSFKVHSNAADVDFVSATWAVEKEEGSIEWTIFHDTDEDNFYKLPDFPSCLSFDQSWFSPEDFKLKSIQSHHYQNFENYEAYINSRYGVEPGGEGSRLILSGGNYEKKTRLQ